MKGKCSTHLVNTPESFTSSEPDYFNEHGDLVYAHAHMVSVKEINCKKIQFPISTDLERVRNSVENSTKCPTVLLKADTGADVNLMNAKTFDTLFKDITVLQPSSLRMEAYGNNTSVEVLGRLHTFLKWKGKVYRQLFYVINANNSPNLLSKDGCYNLGVIKPCYSVDSTGNSSKSQGNQKQHPHNLHLPLRKQNCMLVHQSIVEMKELRWLNGLIPKNPASNWMKHMELH